MSDVCLKCPLFACDESDPGCLIPPQELKRELVQIARSGYNRKAWAKVYATKDPEETKRISREKTERFKAKNPTYWRDYHRRKVAESMGRTYTPENK